MSARDVIASYLDLPNVHMGGPRPGSVFRANAILSALSAMPLASRLALARALVPGWAVVPVEPSRQMMECAVVRHYNKGSLAEVWTAMLTAAEEPPR